MKKIIFTIFTLLMFSITLFAANNVEAYDSQNTLYKQECAACHMGYQAEFLPKRSWVKMMDTLENHFGVDATFDKVDEQKIREYLISNASDSKRTYGHIAKFSRSISSQSTPLAISEIPKFKREHDEIPRRLIVQKEVKTISNCMACHTDAKESLFKERNIFIPNFGRWDD